MSTDHQLRRIEFALQDLEFAIDQAKEDRPWQERAALIDCKTFIGSIRHALRREGLNG